MGFRVQLFHTDFGSSEGFHSAGGPVRVGRHPWAPGPAASARPAVPACSLPTWTASWKVLEGKSATAGRLEAAYPGVTAGSHPLTRGCCHCPPCAYTRGQSSAGARLPGNTRTCPRTPDCLSPAPPRSVPAATSLVEGVVASAREGGEAGAGAGTPRASASRLPTSAWPREPAPRCRGSWRRRLKPHGAHGACARGCFLAAGGRAVTAGASPGRRLTWSSPHLVGSSPGRRLTWAVTPQVDPACPVPWAGMNLAAGGQPSRAPDGRPHVPLATRV